jgi:hypothetical protein
LIDAIASPFDTDRTRYAARVAGTAASGRIAVAMAVNVWVPVKRYNPIDTRFLARREGKGPCVRDVRI